MPLFQTTVVPCSRHSSEGWNPVHTLTRYFNNLPDTCITTGILPFALKGQPSAVLNRSMRFSRRHDEEDDLYFHVDRIKNTTPLVRSMLCLKPVVVNGTAVISNNKTCWHSSCPYLTHTVKFKHQWYFQFILCEISALSKPCPIIQWHDTRLTHFSCSTTIDNPEGYLQQVRV